MADNSVDSIVTDPPYGLSFMGKKWDYDVPSVEIWREALRVLKPGGHLLAFGGTRTYHRLVVAIEDAGFEIKDQIQWLTGQGFPKSLDVKKSAIKQGIACVCGITPGDENPLSDCKNVQSVPDSVAPKDTLSSGPESDLLKDLRGQGSLEVKNGDLQVAAVQVPGLQTGIPPEVAQSPQNLLLQMPGYSQTLAPGNVDAPSINLDKHEGAETPRPALWGSQSRMERRGDVQEEQGQLHRAEVCTVSAGIQTDGPSGRLHYGAPIDNGSDNGPDANADRSGASQGSQYAQQSPVESGILSNEQSAQTCRGCGKAIFLEGFGTALKPANEPICLARKPLEKGLTVAQNVLKWGTGGINIDGSRIGTETTVTKRSSSQTSPNGWKTSGGDLEEGEWTKTPHTTQGRFPANVILDEAAGEMLDEQTGITKSTPQARNNKPSENLAMSGPNTGHVSYGHSDSGGASRFFYCAKASTSERNAGLEGMPERVLATSNHGQEEAISGRLGADPLARQAPRANFHPTVKPIKLMEYLIKLITPPGGIVLDPFMGSGTTGIAARNLEFKFIGIELNEEYFAIAKARINESKTTP